MKHIPTIIIVIILFLPLYVSAQTKEIISEGTYNMGDGETPSVAESRALLQAKRTALEQAGTYVESYSKVINLKLTEDEIQVLASGLMEVEILDKKRTVIGDGIHFWVKIKSKVNPDKIQDLAKRVKEKDVIEDYKKIQEAYGKSQKDIEELKKELAEAKGVKERKLVEAKITDEERLFQANAWFAKGYKHGINNEWDAAIEAFASAIALNPSYAEAYGNLGVAYANKGQFDKAIENYNKSIALNPSYAEAYNNLGAAYSDKGQIDRAIENLNKAIALNPNYVDAYVNLGMTYREKGQLDRAIENFSKAIALNPNYDKAYFNRGLAYANKRDMGSAISNFQKAIILNPNNAFTYIMLAVTYDIEGDMGSAISNLQKACDLGNQTGCENLRKALKKR
ncbi:MAG: tetratricopeptide repeat protein [Deltaproteobacteria bacterium]|nr:tetratricopeptide repeat protein [Deltaproteobacteria bacterium]